MEKLPSIIERNGRLEVVRRSELRQLAIALRAGEYVAISAGPQSGLTTFLEQCRDHLSTAAGLARHHVVLIRGPNGYSSELSAPLVHIAVEVAVQRKGPVKDEAGRRRRLQRIERERGAVAMFESALGVQSPGAIVLIDNIHRLEVSTQRRLFHEARRLREMASQSDTLAGILLVVGGVIEWDRLDPERVSPFSNAATKIPLPDLSREEVAAFVAQHTGERSTRTELIAERIHLQSAGHPYLVARLVQALPNAPSTQLGMHIVDEAVVRSLTEGDDHLRRIRDWLVGLSAEGRRPLEDILRGRSVRRSRLAKDHALEHLLAHGLLRAGLDGRVTFRNLIYARFLRGDPVLRREAWKDTAIAPAGLVSDPIGRSSAEAFLTISRLENRLRTFVAVRLYAELADRWVEEGLDTIETITERTPGQNVRSLGAVLHLRRKKEQAEFSDRTAHDPILAYALLKELEQVILKNWPIFRDALPPQDRFKVYITQLNRVRNRLAHCRRLFPDDLDRLREIELSFAKWLPET